MLASAWDVAVTVTCGGVGANDGAVYSPVADIVPFDVPPATLQLTAVFVDPDTVALNCCVPLVATVALVGRIETATWGGGVELLPPPHPVVVSSTSSVPRHTQGEARPAPLRCLRMVLPGLPDFDAIHSSDTGWRELSIPSRYCLRYDVAALVLPSPLFVTAVPRIQPSHPPPHFVLVLPRNKKGRPVSGAPFINRSLLASHCTWICTCPFDPV